jgi:integrase
MGKLTAKGLNGLLTKPPKRHADGGGLFFKTLGKGRAYWTYRFTLRGRETEMSLGAYPELGLDEARVIHLRRSADVAEGKDPVGERRKGRSGKAPVLTPSGAPTFGHCADQHIAAKEAGWKNSKHHQQWVMTLREYAAPIRDLPVDQVDTAAILSVLRPIWNDKPETASRLRGRIEAVLASAQVDGWIEEGRSNPARWKNWLDHKLAAPKKLGKIDRKTGEKIKRSSHAAMPYDQLPAFMAKLAETPGTAAKALRITILTCARTDETLGMPFDEIDFDKAIWSLPKERMKMGKPHRVPLSDPALAILRRQQEEKERSRSENPFVFAGRPMRSLSNMSMAMLLRRLGHGDVTVHGFRSSFRDWATEVEKAEYTTAERCLAHTVGSDAALSYDRSDRLDLRRPIMARWAEYCCGDTGSNVVQLRAAQ